MTEIRELERSLLVELPVSLGAIPSDLILRVLLVIASIPSSVQSDMKFVNLLLSVERQAWSFRLSSYNYNIQTLSSTLHKCLRHFL
jgi:hypothetical protein